jgi:peptide/nickel transport system substrate-binding protein
MGPLLRLRHAPAPIVALLLVLVFGAVGIGRGAPVQAQADKDTLIVAVPSDLQNLDPTLSSADVYTQEMLTNVYDWLIDYKVGTDANGQAIGDPSNFVGALAEKYEWSADGKTITFTLRDGLKFSNGDPLDANAVKFTYDRIYDQNGVTPFLMKMAAVPDKDHVKVVDAKTIQITVDTPNTLLLGNMAQFGHSILDPKVVQPHMTTDDPYAHEWLKSHTEGTEQGPFKLESWEPGNQWVLVPNPNYWGEQPKLKRIIFKVIPDPSSRLAQLQSGAVDIAYELATTDIKSLEGDSNITVVRQPSRFVVFLGMNSKVPPFDNVKVRQAISWAVPYDTILNDVLNGYGQQLTSPIPNGTPYHTDQYFQYKPDIAKAKQLLTDAGFPNGFETTLQIASGNQEGKETAVYVQQALGQIGIKVTIQEMPGAAFTEQLQKHQLGFFFFNNWISINNDPFYHLYWLFRSDCCNYTNYNDATVQQAIDANVLNTDAAAREKAAMDIQKTIVDEAPWVFLYQPDFLLAMRSNVKGYTYYSADRFTRYKFLFKS